MDLEQYNQKRNAILREFRIKKLKVTGLVLGIALVFAAVALLLGGGQLERMPVVVVVLAVGLMFAVLCLAIRLTQIEHRKQTVLLQFEDEQLLKKY